MQIGLKVKNYNAHAEFHEYKLIWSVWFYCMNKNLRRKKTGKKWRKNFPIQIEITKKNLDSYPSIFKALIFSLQSQNEKMHNFSLHNYG